MARQWAFPVDVVRLHGTVALGDRGCDKQGCRAEAEVKGLARREMARHAGGADISLLARAILTNTTAVHILWQTCRRHTCIRHGCCFRWIQAAESCPLMIFLVLIS